MWLASQDGAEARGEQPLPASMRPDRSKVMIEMGGPKGTNLVLKVPPESPNGQRVRLAGQGMPHLNGTGRGDLFAEITVQLPKNLSAREKDLFAELARVHGAMARRYSG